MSWDAFLEVASATRMQGIELYDIGRDLFKGKASPTNPERAASVRRELISGKLSVPCINTVKDFTAPEFMKEVSSGSIRMRRIRSFFRPVPKGSSAG